MLLNDTNQTMFRNEFAFARARRKDRDMQIDYVRVIFNVDLKKEKIESKTQIPRTTTIMQCAHVELGGK